MAPWIDSAAARGTKLLEALSDRGGHTVPNLVLLSFRRTIMPKGSFFPLPTKTPATAGRTRNLGGQGKMPLPKVHDGDERHQGERHSACGTHTRPELKAPAACERALSNSFGFGGQNISLIVGRYNG
jgi:hypothetical protein